MNAETVLAYIQGRIFEKSGERWPMLDSAAFINRFMSGQAARHLDRLGCSFPLCPAIHSCMRSLKTFRNPAGSTMAYNTDALFWIGYTYRLWQRRARIPSAMIVRIADPEFMYFKGWAEEEEEPLAAIRRIYEEKNLKMPKGLK